MYRIFCGSENIKKDEIFIYDKGIIRHIGKSLRFRTGDKIIVCDNKANEYTTVIKELSGDVIVLDIIERKKSSKDKRKRTISVACAIPKKAKFDDIVDKLTQLGVDRVIPMLTQHVIVKFDRQKSIQRHKRWKKIAESAAMQSQRDNIPVIEHLKQFSEVISGSSDYDLKLIPALIDQRKPLSGIFDNKQYRNILILIGPEGDFSAREVAIAKEHGFIPVTLGDSVLRVDTAAIAVLSFIKLSGS